MTKKSKFQQFIVSEFERRKKINPRYSLRAFAQHLNIQASLLSRILRGKIPLTEKALNRFCEPLNIGQSEYKSFSREIREEKTSRGQKKSDEVIREIKLDEFKFIQDWYHFVILELTTLPGFQPDPEWISKKINITKSEAQMALKRLIDIGELEINAHGELVSAHKTSTLLEQGLTNAAFKRRQKQVLQKASEAMDLIPIELRDQSAITIPVDQELMPEIKERIKKFRRSLATYIEKNNKNADSVYELSVSFFPWTQE